MAGKRDFVHPQKTALELSRRFVALKKSFGVGLLAGFFSVGSLRRLGLDFRRGHRIIDRDFVADFHIGTLGGFVHGDLPFCSPFWTTM